MNNIKGKVAVLLAKNNQFGKKIAGNAKQHVYLQIVIASHQYEIGLVYYLYFSHSNIYFWPHSFISLMGGVRSGHHLMITVDVTITRYFV